jgi:hypothetical protein
MSASVKLRPGTIDAAGNLESGSMAEAIDKALAVLVRPGANEDPRGRRKLAAAIAQGVVAHLVANQSAFMVTVPDTVSGVGTHSQAITIDSW